MNILEQLIGLYTLPADPSSVFLVDGENGPEAVFEIQHSKESNGWNWGWVGCLFCAALAHRNFKVAARRRFGIYERLVNIYGTVHEVYENFKPVRKSLYTSEECFSEALGCYLFAKNMMYK